MATHRRGLDEGDGATAASAAHERVRVPVQERIPEGQRSKGAVAVVQIDDVVDGVAVRGDDRFRGDGGRSGALEVGDGQVLDVVEALQVRVLRQPARGLVAEGAVAVVDKNLDDAS